VELSVHLIELLLKRKVFLADWKKIISFVS